MAKIITQETFDAVVKENVDDFEMEVEEALEDAVKQFQTQGVLLGTIVQDVRAYTKGEDDETLIKHPVLESVENLNKEIDSKTPNDDRVTRLLETIQKECDMDLAHRVLAGKNNSFTTLYKTYEHYKTSNAMLMHVFQAIKSLCDGQPDILETRAMDTFCASLKETADIDLCILIIQVIRSNCVMHEKNRQGYVVAGLIPLLVSRLTDHKDRPEVVKEACHGLRVLTLDDDVRAVAGKAHDQARMIVDEGNALKIILGIAQDYTKDHAVLGELFATISCLAVRNEYCQEIVDQGGLKLVSAVMKENIDSAGIVKKALGVLKSIAGNDQVKEAIVETGCVEQILAAMDKHQANPMVCETGCAALSAVALRHPKHGAKIMACGGHQDIVQAMKVHHGVAGVQRQGCMAIRNIICRNEGFSGAILQLGAESVIQEAARNHSKLHDVTQAALRDLGCDVVLKERWKGEGVALQQ